MWTKIDEVVGNNLKKIRLEQNMTQQALADKANLSKQSISNIESGKGANSKTMERLADCLGVSPLAFYKNTDFKEDIKFKRVTHKDTTADFDTTHYVEEITQTVKNIIASTKKSLYLSSILPTIQQTFSQNMGIVLEAMHAYSDPENHKIMIIFKNVLLSNIKQAIFTESEKQDKKLNENKNTNNVTEKEPWIEELVEESIKEKEEKIEDSEKKKSLTNESIEKNNSNFDFHVFNSLDFDEE